MEVNIKARNEIFKVIMNQIRSKKPPETKAAYERLKQLGYKEFTIKQMIGQCFAIEFYHMMKFRKEFNNERYKENLNNLPKEPVGEE
jgi:Holliday junction resolvasome RuvABC DNA-binding subunit